MLHVVYEQTGVTVLGFALEYPDLFVEGHTVEEARERLLVLADRYRDHQPCEILLIEELELPEPE